MKKFLMVSVSLVCFGLFFVGCDKQTEADLQKMEQDIQSGAGKGEVMKDAETVFEDVKEEVKSGIESTEEKAKDAVEGVVEKIENK